MVLAFSLCWLGTALLMLASPKRLHRALPERTSRVVPQAMRALGATCLGLATLHLAFARGLGMALVSALLLAMVAASLAVLLVALRPRWYIMSALVSVVIGILVASCS